MPDLSMQSPSAADCAELFCLPPGVLYLDTAAHAPMLRSVRQAALDALDAGIAPWRLTDADWEASIGRVRAMAADCFDGDADSVALVPSAAYGIAVAARNLTLARGEAVLLTPGAFPSQALAWQRRSAEVGARIVVAEPLPGESTSDAVLRRLDHDASIRVLSLAQVDWIDGSVLDLDAIAARAQVAGAALVLDLSQSLGASPARIAQWRPAFAVSVGSKWLLGPGGLSYLWCAAPWRDDGAPIEDHWLARDPQAVWKTDLQHAPPFRDGARRFDAGDVAGPQRLAMAEAGLQQIARWRVERIAPALCARAAALREALQAHGLSSWLPATSDAHVLGVRPPPAQLTAVVQELEQAGVVLTVRRGCLRIAPHLHVGVADMTTVATLLATAARR
jgi:selenocysteine lyase/cysteine desulfurase